MMFMMTLIMMLMIPESVAGTVHVIHELRGHALMTAQETDH